MGQTDNSQQLLEDLTRQVRDLQNSVSRKSGNGDVVAFSRNTEWVIEKDITPSGYSTGTWVRIHLPEIIPPDAISAVVFFEIQSSGTGYRSLSARKNQFETAYLIHSQSGAGYVGVQMEVPVWNQGFEIRETGGTTWQLRIQAIKR